MWSERKHDGPFFDSVFEPFRALDDPMWPIHCYFELMEDGEDKSITEEWVHPETGQKVDAMRVFPGSDFFTLPTRFYTRMLSDYQLRRKPRQTKAKPSASGTTSNEPVEFHNLFGLNCYLPNFMVPSHADAKAYQQFSDDLLEHL